MPLASQKFSTSFEVNSPPPSVLKILICFPDCFSAINLYLNMFANTSFFALSR
ncbi:unnamed protein product [Lupinus luteus]|uniref:Uncharacterized protein n=1 Tax=Lupinus luteus TaxID=3873 RepID=A0AAV1XV78_LUPLU